MPDVALNFFGGPNLSLTIMFVFKRFMIVDKITKVDRVIVNKHGERRGQQFWWHLKFLSRSCELNKHTRRRLE